MSIRYYPSNRIKTGLYTNGDSYVLPDGKFYTGPYYVTYDGQAYSGANPVVGTNLLLSKRSIRQQERNDIVGRRLPNITTETYASLPQNRLDGDYPELESGVLKQLLPYFPFPTEEDYSRGYFTRFFAKTVSGPGYIIEISEDDFSILNSGEISPTMLGYEYTNMFWQLTGPLNDKRISQYQIKGGVLTTNKRVTETKNVTFNGLKEFIGGDYTKFARITP